MTGERRPVSRVYGQSDLPVMAASDSDSADETHFTDATSGTDGGGKRRRQASFPEMVRRAAGRQPKRPAPGHGSPSPGKAGGAAKPGAVWSAGPDRGVELSAASLSAIQQLIDSSIARAMTSFEAKFEQLEKRISILECDGVSREIELKKLNDDLTKQRTLNSALQQQIENIDMNGRLSSLILTCAEFEVRQKKEDIKARAVSLLNRRFGDLNLTTADIQAAHRLQSDSKVVVRFVKRRIRDTVYERRFELAQSGAGRSQPGPGGVRRGPPPLYINPRPTGGGGYFEPPPLVFLRYLLNRCRYHRQTCSTLSPNIFTHCVKILKSRVS